MSSLPWDGCYHCNIGTYGAWLPGDPRGWRSRHHHEHVDGDYKNPPPVGKYAGLHDAATQSLKRRRIVFPTALRPLAMELLRDALQRYMVTVAAIAVAATHVHILAQFDASVPATGVAGLSSAHRRRDRLDPRPRYLIGKAMSWTSREIKRQLRNQSPGTPVPGDLAALLAPGGLWAASPRIAPVADRRHFTNTMRYIAAHAAAGAAVWTQL